MQYYNRRKVNICVKCNTVTGYHDKIIDRYRTYFYHFNAKTVINIIKKRHRSLRCLSNGVLLRQDNNIIRTFISPLKNY